MAGARLQCYVPKAENIIADIFIDFNGTERLNITWVFARKPSNNYTYCAGSRKWKVRTLTYDSVEGLTNENFRANNSHIDFVPTNQKRQTYYELPTALMRNKYYIFQVQNSRPLAGGRERSESIIYNSYIHYFGNQSE